MPGVDSFNRNVARYEEWFLENPLAYVSELRAIQSLLPKGKGLEIGVGTGRFAAPLGIRLGIEPSKPMAELAQKKGIDVVAGVAEHLPFGDGEFDFCLMVTTVCFLDDRELAFREAYRVLKPGGAFLIGFVDRESVMGKQYLARKEQSPFYKDATFYSVEEISAALDEAGFGDLVYRQTLFKRLEELHEVEPSKVGYGEGSFVVVQGKKQMK